MAVIAELRVTGTRDQHDALDAAVSDRMERTGGPPAGLMFHLSWPDGDEFVLADVWRTEPDARLFVDDVVLPAVSAVGLRAGELAIHPVWGLARPPAQ